jgi:ABC-type lipoprotein release transport system permease subunit
VALLLGVATLAGWGPAQRAAADEPVVALRED